MSNNDMNLVVLAAAIFAIACLAGYMWYVGRADEKRRIEREKRFANLRRWGINPMTQTYTTRAPKNKVTELEARRLLREKSSQE